MGNKTVAGIFALAFIALAAFVTPADALTINIGGTPTDCTILASGRVGFESGPTTIVGNVCAIGPDGLLDFGSNIRIIGRAIAPTIRVGTGTVIDVCEANTITGPGTCTATQPFPAVPAFPPIAIGPLPACVDTAADFTVPAGTTATLTPGCYGVVTVGNGATLNLSAGNYNVLDLQLENGATIDGAGPAATIVSSKKVITILPNSTITDIRIQTPLGPTTAEVIQIGNNTQVDNSLLYAPFGKLHLHNLSFGTGSEFVSRAAQIEVVNLNPGVEESCPCIRDATKVNATTISLQGIGLAPPTDFFLSLGCGPCPGAGCTAAARVPGGSDTAVNITIPGGLAPGNYHVVAQGTSGTFCTSDLIAIP